MNFHLKSSLLFLINLFISNVFSQTIENIDFSSQGRQIIITFDIINCSPSEKYDISLAFVEVNTNQRIIPKSIRGDIKNQSCGSKKITWYIGEDINKLSGSFYPELNTKKSIINSLNLEFINISSGYYFKSKDNNSSDKIFINSFKMSKYEITFEQYDTFCQVTGRQKPSDNGWGRGKKPVINVSWNNANEFAKWMGGRLPTENEWKYACEAGTSTLYYTGIYLTEKDANFNEIIKQTTSVGSYPPNPFGLYDMYGNVWEWSAEKKVLGGGLYSERRESDPYNYSNVLIIMDRPVYQTGNDLGFRIVLD